MAVITTVNVLQMYTMWSGCLITIIVGAALGLRLV